MSRYIARVLFDGGQIEEYPIGDSPILPPPCDNFLQIKTTDDRAIYLNLAKVISIDCAAQEKA